MYIIDIMEDNRIEELEKIHSRLYAIRQKSDPTRFEAFAYLRHRTKEHSFAEDCPVESKRLYDMTGVQSFDSFIDGFMGAFMSQNQDWFKSRIISKNPEVTYEPDYGNEYTSYVNRAMKMEMDSSNLYEQSKMAAKDTVAGGYSCMLVQNDPENGRCHYDTLMPWRCCFDSDINGNWDTFFYDYSLNGYQMIQKFPDLRSRNPKIYKMAADGLETKVFNMRFCIIKRKRLSLYKGKKSSKIFSKNMRYAAFEICTTENAIIDESGYTDFPVVIHVYSKSGDSPYGEGIATRNIDELRKLNRLGYEYGLSIAKINHGAWLVPESMKNKFSDDPESRTYYQNRELIPIPLQEQQDLKAQQEVLAIQQATVKSMFYNELFDYFLSTDKVYTATQVSQVKSDTYARLSGTYTNIYQQKIDPILKLTFMTMLNNGRIQNAEKYIGNDNKMMFLLDSAMSQTIETYTNITAVNTITEFLQTYLSMGINTPLENMDIDNITRSYMFSSGAPATFFRSIEQRDKDRQDQREAARKQLELEQMKIASEINRNNAGASNLNNVQGNNGGFQ